MKSKRITLFSLALCITTGISNLCAQMDANINASPSGLKTLQGRKVIVEVKEEDQKMIDAINKNKKDAGGLQRYKDFIANNNKMLKAAVDKYWKFNSSIEYKTTTELKDIRGKSSDCVILSYRSLSDENFEETHTYSIPLIWYDRGERTANQEPDYYVYLPVASLTESPSPEEWVYEQADYDFAILQIQAAMNYMISTNKQITYENYGKQMAEANCGKMQGLSLVIDKKQCDEKADESSIKQFYKGPFELTDGTAGSNLVNRTKGKEVIFSFPYGIASGSMGMVVTSALYFAKGVINCETGELMYYYKPPGGMGMGTATTWQYELRKYLFYYMGKCK